MNQTIHVIDLLIALMGVPTGVFPYAARLAHERIEVEDTAVAVVRFAGGALGVTHGTTAAYPGLDAGVRVFGTKGSAIISGDALVYFHAHPGVGRAAVRRRHEPGQGVPRADGRTARPRTGPRGPVRRLRGAIRTDRPVRGSTRYARAALAVVLGVYESAPSGTPVAIHAL